MQDVLMVSAGGVLRKFRFVTPAALSVLIAAGWTPRS